MGINTPARDPAPPAPSLPAVTAAVLGSIGTAVRRAALVAAAHEVDGCPEPGRCRPCAAEGRRRDEADRQAAIAQHAISAERIARRRAADVRRVTATAAVSPSARCRVCKTAADGSKSCRRCGTTTVDASASVNETLRALSPATDPIGFARALRALDRQRQLDEAAACLGP